MVRLAALLWLVALPLRAQEVLAVLSSGLSSYREASAGFAEAYGAGAGVRSLDNGGFTVPSETRVIVAFGRKAAERSYPQRVKLIACLAPGLPTERAGSRPSAINILMVPPADKLLAVLKGVQPGLKRLTVLWSASTYRGYVERLSQASAGLGITIRSERLDGVEDLPDSLRGLPGATDALWLPPDPNFLNAQSFATIEAFGRASGLPVYASVPGLAEIGAVASVFVPFRESGRHAAAAARDILKGVELENPLLPEKTETIINLTAAKKSGLTIPAEALSRATRVLP